MKKILIIGQAPPAVKQEYPYSTTLLYDMLNWVGISKEQAQEMFEFEALVDKFPGFKANNQHALPTTADIENHWNTVLSEKVKNSSKIMVLGNVALLHMTRRIPWTEHAKKLFLMHPSKRNYYRIMKDKEIIQNKLQKFIFDAQVADLFLYLTINFINN